MTMTVEQIEAEALKLPEQARADLLGRLMHSLTDVADRGVAEAWAQEAVRRDDEMEAGSVAGVSAAEVFELKFRDSLVVMDSRFRGNGGI